MGSRRLLALALISVFLALVAACGGGAGDDTAATATQPSATQPPATDAGSGPAKDGYTLQEIVERSDDVEVTIGLALDPDNEGEAFLISQNGIVWRVSLVGERPPAVFGDISDRTRELEEGLLVEYGLLGLAFSPDYQDDSRVYLYYTAKEQPGRNVLSRFHVVDDVIDGSSEQILLELIQEGDNHNGGQLAFGADGYLYVGIGDGGGGGDLKEHGQDLSTLLATIMRLDVSGDGYSIPPDNPFVEETSARPEIYAYGLRNPWRLSFDRESGELWVGDVGEGAWEEINRVVAGGNYGWSVTEGPDCFREEECDAGSFEEPYAVYAHAEGCAAIIGGHVYRGDLMPELDGWYVFTDFCDGSGIQAVNTTGEAAIVRLALEGTTVTSFAELPNGELLVLTYQGDVFQLVPVE